MRKVESKNAVGYLRKPSNVMPKLLWKRAYAITNLIDRNTIRGKRDYAIIILAAVTGPGV
jgi:hypothetical protein